MALRAGVGLAAIQIARRCGAEIFGTAGSPEKRDILRLLGVDHVLNSRTLDFADDVMRLTDGQGVDVILNSLAGEAITKNLNILKPFGRFLEIGKRDFYANSKIGLRPFRNNISYFGINSDTLLIERRDLARRLLGEVLEFFADRSLRPLPYRSFPISRAVEAFRQMQQSRQIGKLVVTMDDDEAATVPVIRRQATVRSDGTYLISGGLSGFGLATALWLAEKGARHFALLGRRGVPRRKHAQALPLSKRPAQRCALMRWTSQRRCNGGDDGVAQGRDAARLRGLSRCDGDRRCPHRESRSRTHAEGPRAEKCRAPGTCIR